MADSTAALVLGGGSRAYDVAKQQPSRSVETGELALGNRRAQASKQYLVSHGIDAGRIETQSWGEEKPLAQGHDEAAWSQNRRDEFEITAGGDGLIKP